MSGWVNAKITKTTLGTKNSPVFTCSLWLEMEHTGCCYGGYVLDKYNPHLGKREATQIGFQAIMELMETLEIDRWEDLAGTYVRCQINGDTSIKSIGHLMKDCWFSFEDFFKEDAFMQEIRKQ